MTDRAVRTIETATHGRYVVAAPQARPVGVLLGFHGYAEDAEVHLAALERISGVDHWLVVAVQALHTFYTRDQRIVASWMTSQDRDLAIADNVAYVRRVVDAIAEEYRVRHPLVCAGFSQGGAMAYRAAAALKAEGLIVLAADVPPDVAASGARLPRVLLGRGTTDRWYTEEKHQQDLATLEHADVEVVSCVFDGGHEWSPDFRLAASAYLAAITSVR